MPFTQLEDMAYTLMAIALAIQVGAVGWCWVLDVWEARHG